MARKVERDIESGCACFSLRRAARMMAQVYDRHLQPVDLKNTQFSLLAALSSRGPLSVGSLADAMAMDRTTLTRNLKILERRKLVVVGPGPDGRTRSIGLTARGSALLKKAMPLWRKAQGSVLDRFGDDRWGSFKGELGDLEQLARSLD